MSEPSNPPPVQLDEQGRPEPPEAAGELDTLVGFLEFHRATLAWRCAGLDAEQLDRALAPSPITLGGLLKHLACVEDYWFVEVIAGKPASPPWDQVDWEADRDWDWHSAAQDTPEQLLALWQTSVERSRGELAAALALGGDGRLGRRAPGAKGRFSLRWVLTHLVEEYARHNGHADLVRESIDGQTGE